MLALSCCNHLGSSTWFRVTVVLCVVEAGWPPRGESFPDEPVCEASRCEIAHQYHSLAYSKVEDEETGKLRQASQMEC